MPKVKLWIAATEKNMNRFNIIFIYRAGSRDFHFTKIDISKVMRRKLYNCILLQLQLLLNMYI